MHLQTEIAFRQAIRQQLLANAPLVSALGGPHVYDEVPRHQSTPYIVLAQSEARDWSTMTETGAEHLLTLEVWSRQHGALEALEIAGQAAALLHDASLTMTGATCAVVRVTSLETSRAHANRFVCARIRLRALIEIA